MGEKVKTARSYNSTIIDDNAVISLNLKWLGQLCVLVGMLVYGYWRVESWQRKSPSMRKNLILTPFLGVNGRKRNNAF